MVAGDEFDFESVGGFEVGGVLLGAAGVGVPVGEEEGPAVLLGFGGEEVDGLFPGVEGEVVEAGGAAVVVVGGEGGGLFEDEVGVVEAPAASVVPGLVGGVAECFEGPLPVGDGAVEVVRVGWGVCGEAGVGVVRTRSSGPGRGVRRCR